MNFVDRIGRYQVVFGVAGIVVSVAGFYRARDIDFAVNRGAEIGWGSYELHLMTYNRLGAITALAFAAIGLVAGLTRRPVLGWIAGAGFGVIAVQGLAQSGREGENYFGGAGQTIAFSFALALVFAATALLSRYAESVDAADQID